MTVALQGLGLGGDLFQKEKDAALTPLLPAGPEEGWGQSRTVGLREGNRQLGPHGQ